MPLTQRPQAPARVACGLCRFGLIPLLFAGALGLLAAGRTFTSFASVKAILAERREQLPAELRNADDAKWLAWSRRQDKAIRARLEQGDLDSMVNLLLLGASFTRQPRIRMEALAEASKSGILRARVDDLVAGLRSPGDNERLIFLQRLLQSHGIDLGTSEGSQAAAMFLYNNLQRVVQERRTLAEHAADARGLDAAGRSGVAFGPVVVVPAIEGFRSTPALFPISRSNRPCAI